MRDIFIVLFLVGFYFSGYSQITLSYNDCDIIKTMDFSCKYTGVSFAKEFDLTDFGINASEDFLLQSTEIAISYSSMGATYKTTVYAIDENFPRESSRYEYLGGSNYADLPYVWRQRDIRTVKTVFENPIVIPMGTSRILIVYTKSAKYGPGLVHVAGTLEDSGQNWYSGCNADRLDGSGNHNNFINADNLTGNFGYPGKDFNWYITASGYSNNTSLAHTIVFNESCEDTKKEFWLTNGSSLKSVAWNFGDVASGTDNTSEDIRAKHMFTESGTYTVSATSTNEENISHFTSRTINVRMSPELPQFENIEACENQVSGTTAFDLSPVINKLEQLGNNVNYELLDGNGNKIVLENNTFSINNTFQQQVSILVRSSFDTAQCCFSTVSFDLIINKPPEIGDLKDLYSCDIGDNLKGFFDLRQAASDAIANRSNLSVAFYDSDGLLIARDMENEFQSLKASEDQVSLRLIDDQSSCFTEKSFKIITNSNPTIPEIDDLLACDSDGDGFTNLYNIEQLKSQILKGRNGLNMTFFNQNGQEITQIFDDFYTNSIAFEEIITIRLADDITTCYSEKEFALRTIEEPVVSDPKDIYSCDLGDGFGTFDLTTVVESMNLDTDALQVDFYDGSSKIEDSQLTALINTTPFTQDISVIVSFKNSQACSTEKSFKIITQLPPAIDLQESYTICGADPFLNLKVNDSYDTYEWLHSDTNELVSSQFEASILLSGTYKIRVTKNLNGITCTNEKYFILQRSELPTIVEVETEGLGFNSLRVIATGDGIFEYSIDGINYQDSNYFKGLSGGSYNVFVRDKNGCGIDQENVYLLDYPQFFTPNGDGYNDYWNIVGVPMNQSAEIYIFDRFGKLLKQFSSNEAGWDGNSNNEPLPSSSYWFTAKLFDGAEFKGYFALKR